MRLKWWQKLVLNAGIAAGVGFFGSLTTLFTAGVTNPLYALIGAGITAGFTFFTTCQHYINEKDPPAPKFRMGESKKEAPSKPARIEIKDDIEIKESTSYSAFAFI